LLVVFEHCLVGWAYSVMPLRTKFTELVGIEHPVLCGGMQYAGYAEMAAAVSNAGGLGTVSALTANTPEKLRTEIQKTRVLTNKPFAVNFTILPMMVTPDYHTVVQAAIDEGIKIVQTAGNSPDRIKVGKNGESLLKMLKGADIIVIHKCMSIKHALAAEKAGVDCISLGAYEYGGHIGNDDITHWVSQPLAGLKLHVPYLAAGATGHGSQLAAALAMGASGVELGTAFMATKECTVKQGIKDAIVQANEHSTTLLLRTVHNVGRFYNNALAKEVTKLESENPGDFGAIAHLMTGKRNYASLQETGDPEGGAWTCGVSAGFINEIPTCKDLIEGLVGMAEQIILERLQQAVVKPTARL
jgi:nitronate monooxygenase